MRCPSTFTMSDDAGPEPTEYEFEIASFYSGSPGGYDDPGDGPETCVGPHVAIYIRGEHVGDTTYDAAVLSLASALGRSTTEIEDMVMEMLTDRACEWYHERD